MTPHPCQPRAPSRARRHLSRTIDTALLVPAALVVAAPYGFLLILALLIIMWLAGKITDHTTPNTHCIICGQPLASNSVVS